MTCSKSSLSQGMSKQLDYFGYGRKRVKQRILCCNLSSDAKTLSTKHILQNDLIEKFFVGSQREGVALSPSCDTDVLQVNNAFICVDDIKNATDESKVVLHLQRKEAPTGYGFLCLRGGEERKIACKDVEHALVKFKGKLYLSSRKYFEKNGDVFHNSKGWVGKNTNYTGRKGPSIHKTVNRDFFERRFEILQTINNDFDIVQAFPCHCPEILNSWCDRKRKYDWPSPSDIKHVASLPAHVVPVGLHGSKDEDLQWRICYTMAEIHLIQSFNDTQTKLYVLMKLIAKHALTPVCSDITSYIMKNIMFWLSESKSLENFQTQFLLSRLEDALIYLKKCLKKKKLPNYMIPGRNLFLAKLKGNQRRRLLTKIDCILQHGTEILMEFFMSDVEPDSMMEKELKFHEYWNIVDQIFSKRILLFNTNQLADYYNKHYYWSSRFMLYLHHHYHVTIPYLRKYGRKDLTDPLDLEVRENDSENKVFSYLATNKRTTESKDTATETYPDEVIMIDEEKISANNWPIVLNTTETTGNDSENMTDSGRKKNDNLPIDGNTSEGIFWMSVLGILIAFLIFLIVRWWSTHICEWVWILGSIGQPCTEPHSSWVSNRQP